MPGGNRAAMIQSMVDSLARRLEQSPRDAEPSKAMVHNGWR
jgi:hypothetical protein